MGAEDVTMALYAFAVKPPRLLFLGTGSWVWVPRERREELTPVCLLAVRGRVRGKARCYLMPVRGGMDKDEVL